MGLSRDTIRQAMASGEPLAAPHEQNPDGRKHRVQLLRPSVPNSFVAACNPYDYTIDEEDIDRANPSGNNLCRRSACFPTKKKGTEAT